jgi:hypothetical protein
MASAIHSHLAWRDPSASSGEVFRLGQDVAYREGGNRLRIMASSTPDKAYRQAFLEAVDVVAQAWGTRIEIVLDFSNSVPSGPGQAVRLCRELHASGHVDRIVVLQHPGVPAWLLSSVSRILRSAGLPVEVEEAT